MWPRVTAECLSPALPCASSSPQWEGMRSETPGGDEVQARSQRPALARDQSPSEKRQEVCHLRTQEAALPGDCACQHLGLGLPASRTGSESVRAPSLQRGRGFPELRLVPQFPHLYSVFWPLRSPVVTRFVNLTPTHLGTCLFAHKAESG